MEFWIANTARRSADAPLAWAIGAAVIATVFAIVVMIVSYGPLNRTAKDDPIETALPAARYDAVKALINATGQACSRICAVTSANALSVSETVDVACASPSRPNDCVAPVHYRIAVAPSE